MFAKAKKSLNKRMQYFFNYNQTPSVDPDQLASEAS